MIQAAELDLTQSQYSAALMYYQGVGGPIDKAAALSWLAIAARTNDARLVQAALQLDAEVTPAERAKAQQLAKQHDKVIADNKARLRAIATGHAPPGPASTPPADKPLDRAAIVEIQKLLAALKLYTGAADGTTGSKTEQAIRDYQAMAGLPVDGKATPELLTSLRDVAGAVTPK
jgi:TPR repeat protein